MVNKTGRCGLRSGNTIRKSICKYFCANDSYIEFNTYNRKYDYGLDCLEDELLELGDGLQENPELDQHGGGLNSSSTVKEGVLFSLKKRKRSLFSDSIDFWRGEEFRVVVAERRTILTYNETLLSPHWDDYVKYLDSRALLPIVLPFKKTSHFSELRRKSTGRGEDGTVQDRKRWMHNQKSRPGLQRKTELLRQKPKVNNIPPYKTNELIAGLDSDIPEVRYTICQPTFSSRFRPQRLREWMFLRSRDLLRCTNARRQNLSKKAMTKQKGCVNGRKTKRWQKWNPKDTEECLLIEYDRVTSPTNVGRVFSLAERTVLNNETPDDSYIQGLSFLNSGRQTVTLEKKSTLDVSIEDLLRQYHEKYHKGHKTKHFKKKIEPFTTKKKVELATVDQTKHIVYPDVKTENANNETKENTSFSNDNIESQTFIACVIKKSEFDEFLKSRFVQHSESCFPPIISIPLVHNINGNAKHFTPESSLRPSLLLQESTKSVVFDTVQRTGIYRLKINADSDILWNVMMENIRAYVSGCGSSPSSLWEIYNLSKRLVKEENYTTDEKPVYVTKVSKPLFDWMTTVTYRVSTIDHVYKSRLNQLELKTPHLPFQLTKAIALTTFTCSVCLTSAENSYQDDGLLLLPCQHIFCRNCVFQYTVDKIEQGATEVTCLENECNSIIDEVMILYLVPCPLYRSWSKRHMERTVMSREIWKWCPNLKCGKIVSVSDKIAKFAGTERLKSLSERREVTCVCKAEFCVDCQQPPHWPATCRQARTYHKISDHVIGILNDVAIGGDRSFLVEVKTCPRCQEKINKNGGCQVMTCRCGNTFCWLCLRPMVDHKKKDMCRNGSNELVEFSSRINYKLPTNYMEKAISCRLMQRRLIKWKKTNFGRLQHKMDVSDFEKVAEKHPGKQQDKAGAKVAEFRHLNLFIKTLNLLENIFVSLPPISNSFQSRRLTKCEEIVNRVDFISKRLEEMLLGSVKQKDCQKLKTYQNLLSDKLCDLCLLSIWIRKELRATDQWRDWAEDSNLSLLTRASHEVRRSIAKKDSST
ncbi:uncharacterized protein LOC133188045 [Saccostrea echinata]|uniref:uncharacterized protein LOC133188045 n=1 Tax=Saccostrea echinata TaxID=191078 RepID=UPI002A803BBA|nr:uncharacterized protein LOC133188045 [Saccostrea echinata]